MAVQAPKAPSSPNSKPTPASAPVFHGPTSSGMMVAANIVLQLIILTIIAGIATVISQLLPLEQSQQRVLAILVGLLLLTVNGFAFRHYKDRAPFILNVLLQIVLLMVIFGVLNFISFKRFKQFDFSQDRKFALSTRTKQFLASLNKPAKLIVFMSAGNNTLQAQVLNDADTMAHSYRTAQPKFISLEIVDPYRDVGRASEVQAKYKLLQQENVIIVACEDRQKILKSEDLVDLDQGNEMFGQQPSIKDFKSEQAITNALLEVTEGKKSSVYYLRGHGEPDIGGKGVPLELLGRLLDGEHLNIADLNLLNVEAVPSDSTLLMILAPKYDLSEREVKLLEDYWNKGGRIMLALNPDVQTPRLGIFLDRLGVRTEDDRVLRTVTIAGGVTGIVRDVYAQVSGATPMAKELAGVNLVFLGSTQSLTLSPERVSGSGIKLAPLATAIKDFWGEMDYKDMENTGVYFDKGKDKEAPLVLAASLEKGAVGDQRVQVSSSRLIVLGTARFLESDAMNEADANFFVSSLDWLLSREQLIGIAPRQLNSFTLNLQDKEISTILWTTTAGVPAIFAFIGLIVWWRRRA